MGGREPQKPESKGVGVVLCRPSTDAVLVQSLADEAVDEIREADVLEARSVFAVIFEEHEESSPKSIADIRGIEVASSDDSEGAGVADKL